MGQSPQRTIVHVDMDAFFASVEILRHPELVGRPVVVGGSGNRGVVAAASYEARFYGVHSAMPSVRARRLCPDAVFLSGDHAHYREVSERVMAIFLTRTPLVEPLSLDEAFLDVSGTRRTFGEPVALATQLREQVLDETGLYCSIGIAQNKFLAKLATSEAKPRASRSGPVRGSGVFHLTPDAQERFLASLPISRIWGVGPATLARLQPLGIDRAGDLLRASPKVLAGAIGEGAAVRLIQLAQGLDDRTVTPDADPKSISQAETFARDLTDRDELHGHLVRQADSVAARLRAHGLRARTVHLKVRYGNFQTLSRSWTSPRPFDGGHEILGAADGLFSRIPIDDGVRLIGLGVSSFDAGDREEQLTLDSMLDGDGVDRELRDRANSAVDEIRQRFGTSIIGPASAPGLHRTQGDQQWGPNAP